jgi:hypothetical protein
MTISQMKDEVKGTYKSAVSTGGASTTGSLQGYVDGDLISFVGFARRDQGPQVSNSECVGMPSEKLRMLRCARTVFRLGSPRNIFREVILKGCTRDVPIFHGFVSFAP